MATTETVEVLDDKSLFQAAMADEPAQEAPAPEQQPEPQPAEQPRDEAGRFAAKDNADAPPTQAQPEQQPVTQQTEPKADDKDGAIPSWRLREEREAREAARREADEWKQQNWQLQQRLSALERQRQQPQTPQEPVDFFQNPDGALDQRINPLRSEFGQAMQEMQLSISREFAVMKHGEDEVSKMETAVQQGMMNRSPDMLALRAQMQASRNPVAVAMNWYKEKQLVQETGGDMAKYRQRILDEAAKDPEFQKRVIESVRGTQQNDRPAINLPPSVSRLPGSGGAQGTVAAEADAMSDREIFRHAMAP